MKYYDKVRPADNWTGWECIEFPVNELTDLTKGTVSMARPARTGAS